MLQTLPPKIFRLLVLLLSLHLRSAFGSKPPNIYVYDLPPFGREVILGFLTNEASPIYGPAINLSEACCSYNTRMFGLEVIIYDRMLQYRHRTSDPSAADLFFVPFFPEVARTAYKRAQKPTAGSKTRASVSFPTTYLRKTLNYIKQQAPWKRRAGKDHIFVASRPLKSFVHGKDNCLFGLHSVVLTIESPFLVTEALTPYMSVPYPSWFHFHSKGDSIDFPWKHSSSMKEREWLVVFIGTNNTFYHSSLRNQLLSQCQHHRDVCSARSFERRHLSTVELDFELYKQAVFSLQPPGDTLTRKGVFDALLFGSIPVVFHPSSMAYPAFIPKVEDVAIVIPLEKVISERLDVIEVLKSVPEQEVQRLQKNIEAVAFGLQYSLEDNSLELKQSQNCRHKTKGACDAFDLIIEQLSVYVANGYGNRNNTVSNKQCNHVVGHCLRRPDYAAERCIQIHERAKSRYVNKMCAFISRGLDINFSMLHSIRKSLLEHVHDPATALIAPCDLQQAETFVIDHLQQLEANNSLYPLLPNNSNARERCSQLPTAFALQQVVLSLKPY